MGNEVCVQGDSAEQAQRDQLVDLVSLERWQWSILGQQCLWKMKSDWRGEKEGTPDRLDVAGPGTGSSEGLPRIWEAD